MRPPRQYTWLPPHRPPPAGPSLAGRIALLGPVGKCLETALDELLAEDRATTDADAVNDDGSTKTNDGRRGLGSKKKRKRAEKMKGGEKEPPDRDDGSVGSLESTPNNNHMRLDEATSKSMLEAYSQAVAETKFDYDSRKASAATASVTRTTNDANIAPAAMLKGEIDHFNRVGGQWRIVVKNAVLKERTTTRMAVAGSRGLRKKTFLDWGDDEDERVSSATSAGNSVGNTAGGSASDVHKFPGTIQILAYDDDT